MPQMSPIMWELMFLMFTMLFFLMIIFTFFYIKIKMTKYKNNVLKIKYNWKW